MKPLQFTVRNRGGASFRGGFQYGYRRSHCTNAPLFDGILRNNQEARDTNDFIPPRCIGDFTDVGLFPFSGDNEFLAGAAARLDEDAASVPMIWHCCEQNYLSQPYTGRQNPGIPESGYRWCRCRWRGGSDNNGRLSGRQKYPTTK